MRMQIPIHDHADSQREMDQIPNKPILLFDGLSSLLEEVRNPL